MKLSLKKIRKAAAATMAALMVTSIMPISGLLTTVWAAAKDDQVNYTHDSVTDAGTNVKTTTSKWDFTVNSGAKLALEDTVQGLVIKSNNDTLRVYLDASKDMNIKNAGGVVWVPIQQDTTKVAMIVTPQDNDTSRFVYVGDEQSPYKLYDASEGTSVTIRDIADYAKTDDSGNRYIPLVSGGNFKMKALEVIESNIVSKVTVNGSLSNISEFAGNDITQITFKNTTTEELTTADVTNGTYSVVLDNEYSYIAGVVAESGQYGISTDSKVITLSSNSATEERNFVLIPQAVAKISGEITVVNPATEVYNKINKDTFSVKLVPADSTMSTLELSLTEAAGADGNDSYTFEEKSIIVGMEYSVELTGANDYEVIGTIKKEAAETDTAVTITANLKKQHAYSGTPYTSDGKDTSITSITFTNMDEEGYAYTFSDAAKVKLRDGNYEVTAIQTSGNYEAFEHVSIGGADALDQNIYLNKVDVSAPIRYDLPTELKNADTALTFTSINGNNTTSVKGVDGATIDVPVRGTQKVTVAIWYSGTVDINGKNAVTADSTSNASSPVTTSYTSDGTETSVTVKCSGNAATYLYWIEVEDVKTGSPYEATVKVGTGESLKTIQAAVDYIEDMERTEEQRTTIQLTDALYREQVVINVPNITIESIADGGSTITWYYGLGYAYYSADPTTKLYSEMYAVDQYYKNAPAQSPGKWGATVWLNKGAAGFKAEGITFENSFNYYVTAEEIADGIENVTGFNTSYDRTQENANVTLYSAKERACTMYSQADQVEFYNCQFYSSQDTIYTGDTTENSYYYDCVISGTTDYICGDGNAVFDQCELQWYGYSDKESAGVIMASKGSAERGYYFYNCKITKTTDEKLQVAQGHIGRPWNTATEKVLMVNTVIEGDTILPAGWTTMSTAYPPEDCAVYEYNTMTEDGTKVDLSQRRIHALAEAPSQDRAFFLNGWNVTYLGADYTSVNTAIMRANALNKDYYDDLSAVTEAVKEVVSGKKNDEQAAVTAMAAKIDKAIDSLVMKDADYTELKAAIAKVQKMDASLYVDFTAVSKAAELGWDAVNKYKIDQQSVVDGYTQAITDAINALVLKEPETEEPTTKPTEPETKPTEPETKPTEPETKPTEPTTDPVFDKAEVSGDAALEVSDTGISQDAVIKNEAGDVISSADVKVEVKAVSEEKVAEVKEIIKSNNVTVSENAVVKVFEIDLSDKSGNVVKLDNGKVRVTLAQDTAVDYSKVDVLVYHVKEDGTVEKLDVTVADGKATFDTTSFSPYMIVYAPKTETVTTTTETSAQTGDMNASALYVILAMMAAFAMMGLVFAGKKRRA